MFAIMSYCNFHDTTDRYEIFVAMKELGVTSADRPEIMAIRDKNYQIYRNKFDTPAKQEELCKQARFNFFFVKTRRKGVPISAGSDTDKQPEKIEAIGKILGVISFCQFNVDETKWGQFLVNMGVKVESMKAVSDQAGQLYHSLITQHGFPERAPEVCAKTKNDFWASSFIK